jgi:hypothetical protein
MTSRKTKMKLGVVVHACNPSSQEAEAEGLWIWGQPEFIVILSGQPTRFL